MFDETLPYIKHNYEQLSTLMAFIYTWYACIKWGVVQMFLSDCTVMMILLISNRIVDTPSHNTHLPTSNISYNNYHMVVIVIII